MLEESVNKESDSDVSANTPLAPSGELARGAAVQVVAT